MGKHRNPPEPATARLTRTVRAVAAPRGAAPAPEELVSRRDARRRGALRGSSTGLTRLAAQPWLTVVLLLLVTVVGYDVVRPDSYAATATVTAADDRATERAAVALTRTDVMPRVEEAIELEGQRRGRIGLHVDHPPGRRELLVTATARDPRLAALAADTAAALVVSERTDVLTLSGPAAVPTGPEDGLSPWWLAGGLAALALALLVERLHERWELRHTPVRRALQEPA